MSELGRLTRVPALRETWPDEARDFTPWLAQPENLAMLSDLLGLGADGLELEAVERLVGPYRVDILCRRTDDDGSWVLIENQLERTDHSHLGQIVTYAAGLDARLVVWISARVTPEHRAAVDWLNRIAGEDGPSFFALEIELWRIDDSRVAPRLNAVATPDHWTRQATRAKASLAEGGAGEARQLQLEYWSEVCVLVDAEAPFRAVTARPQGWVAHGIGRTGVGLNLVMNAQERWLRCEVYLSGPQAKAMYRHLVGRQAEIEDVFGEALKWEELPRRQASRIASYLCEADPANREDWMRQHRWLVATAIRLHNAFRPVIAAMPKQFGETEEPE